MSYYFDHQHHPYQPDVNVTHGILNTSLIVSSLMTVYSYIGWEITVIHTPSSVLLTKLVVINVFYQVIQAFLCHHLSSV